MDNAIANRANDEPPKAAVPVTVPITTAQYETLVSSGAFDNTTGQCELIDGRIVHMNPQGPEHADP